MTDTHDAYREPNLLTALVFTMMGLQVLAALIVGGATLYAQGDKLILPPGVFETYEAVRGYTRFCGIPLLILLMFWFYRISRNTHCLARKPLEFSPGWAVGWWFVPFASWVQPLRVVTELYNANADPENFNLRIPLLLGLWWALTLVGIMAGLVTRFARLAHDPLPSSVAGLILLNLALHQALALLIYARIARRQKRARRTTLPGVEQLF